MKIKPFRLVELLLHYVTIAALLYKGISLVITKLYFPAFIILLPSVIAMIITCFWKQFAMTPRIARLSCYYLEMPALITTAYVFSLESNVQLSQLFLLAAIVYPVYGYFSSKRKNKKPSTNGRSLPTLK